MGSRTPRVGIERKILTSILVVGILPMAVALTFGYIAARSVQSSSVQQTLHSTAQNKAEAIRLLSNQRLEQADRLAADPSLKEAVSASADAETIEEVRSRIFGWANSDANVPTRIAVYDADGDLVLASDENRAETKLSATATQNLSAARFDGYTDLSGQSRQNELISRIIAPILTGEGVTAGYLYIASPVTNLLLFAMEPTVSDDESSSGSDHYQFVYVNENGPRLALTFSDGDGSLAQRFRLEPVDAAIADLLIAAGDRPQSMLTGIQIEPEGPVQDVMLAFHETTSMMQGPGRVFFVVFRPVSDVFSKLNSDSLLALIGGVIFVAFLCVNAYRETHNNIVRPISLLNDGAQIVQHGDFDLKLKIGTGDEIEALAGSFNRMAAALKKNIHQLGESEERYRSLITSMRDGIFQTDTESRVTFMNPAGLAILGFRSMDAAIGVELRTLFDDDVCFDPQSDRFDEIAAAERTRMWMTTKDGRRICVELSRSPDYDAKGKALGVEGTFRDVTEGVRLEQEARERAERISAINQIANVINSSLEAGRLYESLVVELKRLIDCDYVAVALLSEDNKVFEGRQLWPDEPGGKGQIFTLDAHHSSSGWVARERKLLQIDDLLDGPSPFHGEFPLSIRGCLCMPLYATGRIIGTLNIGSRNPAAFTRQDIDGLERMAPHLAVAIRNAQLLMNLQLSLEEVTRAREKLHAVNEELKTLDEMKTNLLSNVSHELRTPLVAVMGYSDMLLNGKAGPINTTQQEFLEISLRNVEKLVTLIENLLDFSKLHRGDDRLVFDSFDLVDCARASIQNVQPVADTRGIKLELITPEPSVVIEGDKSKMGQVFNNLLHNGVKFNHDDGKVIIELRLGDDFVEVTVSDTGIGMPPEACERVFTRFYQYDGSSTRKYGGTGIGLSIAQDIVRLHGGTISVTSEEGNGSVFRFRLGLSGVRRRAGDGEFSLPDPEETHILVELVTDDRSLSLQLRSLLAADRIDVIHASARENVLTLAEKYRPDCVLVDLNNLESGEPLLNALLDHPMAGQLPVVILTNEDEVYERYANRVSARVKRSFRKSSLLSGIHHAVNQRPHLEKPVGEKILCVDDDLEVLDFMQRCLEAEGFAITLCSSGEEAVELVRSHQYGLVLLDIAMPGMDGWETCRRIRKIESVAGINIYMVTAKPIERNLSKVRECGADGFLLKPFRPEDLVELAHGLSMGQVAK